MKKVFLTFAGERKDVSHLVSAKSIRLSSSLCGSTNKSTIDSLSFSLEYTRDKSLKALFFNSQKIWVEVFNPDGSPFFTGYIPDGISQVLDGLGEVISLEAYDNSWRLDMDCLDFVAERCRVCDPDNPENSIVHRLLLAAGYAQNELDLTLPVDTELRVVAAEAGDSTWREILDNLLSEYGAVIFFDAAGKATLREWYPTDTNSAVVVNEHAISAEGVARTKAEKEYNAVTVEWSNVRDTADPGQTGKENLYIASLNYQPKTNGEGETGTKISKGFYWPTSVYSDTEEVWQSYNIDDVLNYTDVTNDKELFRKRSQNKNLSLLYSYDHELSIRDQSQPDPDQWGTVLTVLHKEFKFKKARILLKNETDDVVDLYRLNVRAHAVFRYNKNEQTSFFVDEVTGDRLEDETKSYTYTSKYIYDSEPAEALAARLRRQKQFGAFEYEFSAIAELPPGTVISLTQKDEFDTFAVVTKAEVEDENPMVKYTAQGLTAYLGDVSTGVSGEPSAPPWQDKVDQIKPEIEGDIFGSDAVFGDTTAVPVMVVQAQFHANLIRVLGFTDGKSEEMQLLSGLINFAGVQYQCRKTDGEWGNLVTFSAGETPQTPGGWTFDDSANRVHWYSFGVDAGGSAVAYPLEYRVRLVMSSGDVSQWSAVQSSTASVIENGDIAANAITANNIEAGAVTSEKIAAGTLDALFIKSEQVTLSSNAADPKNPNIGDKKIDITKDGLKFYECTTKGIWTEYSNLSLTTESAEKLLNVGSALNTELLKAKALAWGVSAGSNFSNRQLYWNKINLSETRMSNKICSFIIDISGDTNYPSRSTYLFSIKTWTNSRSYILANLSQNGVDLSLSVDEAKNIWLQHNGVWGRELRVRSLDGENFTFTTGQPASFGVPAGFTALKTVKNTGAFRIDENNNVTNVSNPKIYADIVADSISVNSLNTSTIDLATVYLSNLYFYYNNNKIRLWAINSTTLQLNAALKAGKFVSTPYITMTGSPPSTSGSECSLGGYAGGVKNIKCYIQGDKRSIGTASSSWT